MLPECIGESELVSRGQLSHPPADLYNISQYLFAYYKSVAMKSFVNPLIVAFQEISEVSACCEYDKSVLDDSPIAFRKDTQYRQRTK